MNDLEFFSAISEAIKTDSLNLLSQSIQQQKEQSLREIDLICEANYADLVEVHQKIYELKPTLDQVQRQLEEIESSLSQSIEQHSQMIGQLQVLDSLYDRIANGEEVIRKYWEVFQLLTKADLEMKNREFFCAIKTFKEVQMDYLMTPLLSGIPFSQKIHLYIHRQLKETQRLSFEGFSAWLSEIHSTFSTNFGKIALECTERLSQACDSTTAFFMKNELNLEGDEEFEAANQQLSFICLFEALYVHTLLDERDSFIKNYLKLRNEHLKKIVQVEMPNTSNNFKESLQKIAGFFIFEVFALSNSQIFYSKSLVENNWIFFLTAFYKTCQSKLAEFRTTINHPEDEKKLCSFKDEVVTFTLCLSSFEYRFESLSSLFSEMFIKYALGQKETFSSMALKIMEPSAVRKKFQMESSSTKDQRLTFLKHIPIITGEDSFPFSQVTGNLFLCLMEYANKLYAFSAGIPQDSFEFVEMAKRNVQTFISDVIAGNVGICKIAAESKNDIETLKILYHTLVVFDGAIWTEICEWFASKRPLQISKRKESSPTPQRLLSTQFTRIQQIILRDLEAKIEQLLPLGEENSDFLHYLKSIYQIKLFSLPDEVRELIFWNVLSFINNKLIVEFWAKTGGASKGTKFEGPDSPIFHSYKAVIQEIYHNFHDEFPEKAEEYLAIFSPLIQTLQCIEKCAYFDLTAQQTRKQYYPAIEIPKMIPTLEALRISNWASKTPSPTNEKITMKTIIEDVLKRLKIEFPQ